MKLHETDDGFFCFLDEPTDSLLWLAFFRSRETALRAWELAQASAAAPDLLNLLRAADRLEELTGENLAVYARTFAALARSAIARATGGNAS